MVTALENLTESLSEIRRANKGDMESVIAYLVDHCAEYSLTQLDVTKILTYAMIQVEKLTNKDIAISTEFMLAQQTNEIAFLSGKISFTECYARNRALRNKYPVTDEVFYHKQNIINDETDEAALLADEYTRLIGFEGIYGVIASREPVTEEMLRT